MNCFHSYPSKKSLEKHTKVCEDKEYCYIEMPKHNDVIKYNHGEKSMKNPYVIYSDTECLIKK